MNAGFSVAAATVALADRLHALIGDAVPGARVTTLNPGAESLRGGDPIVNLYLFRTARNGFVSNDALPTRSAAGRALASPVLKLDLDYMITFFGDEVRLDPQRLLGLVVGGLSAEPYITRRELHATIASTPWLGGGPDPELPGEDIRVASLNMPPDGMARLWSEFIHVPYQLTQLYTVTPVPLVTVLPVEPVLPVRRIGLRAVPSGGVAILAVVNAADPSLPLQGGGEMAIRLLDPAQPGLLVEMNGVAAEGVRAGFDADGFAALLVGLTAGQAAALTAGPLAVRVIRMAGPGGVMAAASPVARTSIVPAFAQPPAIADGQLVATMTLPVGPESAAAALLFPRGAAQAGSRRIVCLARDAASTGLAAPLAGVPAGTYLVSVEIDGVATLLDFADGAYTGPTVDVIATG